MLKSNLGSRRGNDDEATNPMCSLIERELDKPK